jgi:hypothetical protein
MSELDTLTEQFERLLEGVRSQYTLEEWRYAYRKVLYSGAIRILKDFPVIFVGTSSPKLQEDPVFSGGVPIGGQGPLPPPKSIAGERPPYRPSAINQLVCIALGNCPPPHN